MKITLTDKAAGFLQSMLAEAGWTKSDHAATSIKRTFLASKLLSELPASFPADLTLDDKTFGVCKEAISWFIKEGRVPSGPASLELITLFELYKE